ncbi:hypothetical protein J5N97_000317 [Dioscorea zingiberensis]|uniref:Holocarboxylase synthetase n=1 Tax=Dioscorea zingiberensis TaxID=325984 RepID=A0A9D5BSM1_9LILI|nr:hypothetical protein J5N97_000317 [Dioscorea zingiberensis]
MAKKRKSEANRMEEADRTMYSAFCGVANSLSHLYSLAVNQHKLAFHAGERHALEKLYQWIVRQHEEGSRLTAADIVAHLQNEIEYGGDEASASPRLQAPNQHPQSNMHFANAGMQTSSGVIAQAAVGHTPRASQSDQAKNLVFSNALSSPVRRSLQSYQLAQGGYYQSAAPPASNEARNHEANSTHNNRGSNSPSSNDSMDMHSDSPAHEPY